jgi:flagellar hook assembly protein FlgD
VEYTPFPGNYALQVYNSAGEHVKTLDSQYLNASIRQSYSWDGTNKYGNPCASGLYLFCLTEPFGKKIKRILLVR